MFGFLFNRKKEETVVTEDNPKVGELLDNKCEPKNVCNISAPGQLDMVLLHSEIDSDDQQEKLIAQVLEVREALDDMCKKIHSVKQHNARLKNENHVLSEYMADLMDAASVLHPLKKKNKEGDIYYWR